jgi:Zn-dependent M28 family amino/carboxypeptidase
MVYGEDSFMENLEKNLRIHVEKLALEIGERNFRMYEKLQQAAEYIAYEFKKYGYKYELQEYYLRTKQYKNIIATHYGVSQPDRVIIIGAHYDSVWGSPGADDNGSGVAGLLELARLISHEKTSKSVKFIAFVNEEPPFFRTKWMGSNVYVRQAYSKKEVIDAMLCLESIGYFSQREGSQNYPPFFNFFYPNKGNFIAIVGNLKSKSLVKEVVESFRKNSDFPIESVATFGFIPGVDFSDHLSFWKYGYKAVMITDTAFYRNPNYHTQSDLPHTLDYKSLSEVVKGLYHVILSLANK